TLWDAATDSEPRTFSVPQQARPGTGSAPVALSPDGRFFATANDLNDPRQKEFCIHICDSVTGVLRHRYVGECGHTAMLHHDAMAFSADGKKLVTGSHDGTIKLWDIESRGVKDFPASRAKGCSGRFCGVALSADGRWIASTCYEDKQVKLWKVDSDEVFLVG